MDDSQTESSTHRPLSIVVAGGGTAGHIEPALSVAEEFQRRFPDARLTALGTPKGLENTVVPARGFDLQLIPAVPVPRRINKDLLTLPWRLVKTIRDTAKILTDVDADAVIGFGGYVSAPAYIAAKLKGIPVFAHEANARAGMSNKLGVKLGAQGFAAVDGSGIKADVVGIPVKEQILTLDRTSLESRRAAREFFGLDQDVPVVFATGGSQGAQSINSTMERSQKLFADAGIGVLHAYGPKNSVSIEQSPGAPVYKALPYIDRMDLAYSAADFIICRSGAMTVSEVSSIGLPALYVPLPHGNGEQALNAEPIVRAGGAFLVDDADFGPETISSTVIPVLKDPETLETMGNNAQEVFGANAAQLIVDAVLSTVLDTTEEKK